MSIYMDDIVATEGQKRNTELWKDKKGKENEAWAKDEKIHEGKYIKRKRRDSARKCKIRNSMEY